MKQIRVLNAWGLRIALFILFLGGVTIQSGYSFLPVKDEIEIQGEWEEKLRSITRETPITASISDDLLSIQSTSQKSNITIDILDENGEIVWQGYVPARQTANIAISIVDFPSGMYTLELRNQWGDYVYGSFTK